MFQAPFFDKSFPSAMNYGSLGETIGHEFTHGFDYHGSQNDEQGNEKNWWEPETKANYQKQKKCIIDEYSAFVVPELNVTVNGTRTEFENMADNGGIKEAFMAYQAYLKKLGHREKPLKGMERFTSEQLFFISYAMKWCSKQTKETLRHDMQFQHAPARARANVVVSNMPEFATAFKSAKGSPMNPAKKCQVW